MKYPEAGGTQSENHTTRPTPHHTEALEKHRTVGFSAAKAVQGRCWPGRILVWPRSWIGMGWLGVVWFLIWGWRVLLGWELGQGVVEVGAATCGFVAVAGRGLAIEGSGAYGRLPFVLWAEVCSNRPAGQCVIMLPPGNRCGSLSSGPGECMCRTPVPSPGTGGRYLVWIPRDRRMTARVQGLGEHEQDGRTLGWERGWSRNSDAKAFQSRVWGRKAGFVGGAEMEPPLSALCLTYIIDSIQNIC